MIALLAPGQGSQSPGMLTPWLDAPDAEATLARWSAAIDLDLQRLGTTAARRRSRTRRSRSRSSWPRRCWPRAGSTCPPGAPVAGHSVGELAAAAIAGVLDPDAAVALAAVRGREMAAACALEPTGMSAVLGGNPDDVLATLERLGLDPANRNGAGQTVAAGPLPALAQLAEQKPEKARVMPLAVAGAFHTRFMAPAEEALRAHAASITPCRPDAPAALQRRRRRRRHRAGGAAQARRAGHPPGALGRLHGDARTTLALPR